MNYKIFSQVSVDGPNQCKHCMRNSKQFNFHNPDIQNERRRPNVNRKLVHYEVNYPNNKIYLCIQQIKS